MIYRPTICIDFDGVLHRYVASGHGVHHVRGQDIPGAIAWLHNAIQTYDVAVLSARSYSWRARRAMRQWLRRHCHTSTWCGSRLEPIRGLREVRFVRDKPVALFYLDDRALRFDGPTTFPDLASVDSFRSWTDPQPSPHTGTST